MEQASPATDLRYPAGRFEVPASITPGDRARYIAELAALPGALRAAVSGLTEPQIDTAYREGGWTVRQVIHHVADSHLNSLVRFKLALTESEPTIKPYDEAAWAKLADSELPVEVSLNLIEALHTRFVALLRSLSEADYQRTFKHPERGLMRLDVNLALYAWHGRHHTSHITSLRQRMGW